MQPIGSIKLSRLAIIACVAAALDFAPGMPVAFAAPAAMVDLSETASLPRPLPVRGLDFGAGNATATLDLTDPAPIADAERGLGDGLTSAPAKSWFDTREFEFTTADDNSAALFDAGGCVYPDSYLRSLGGGPDECSVLMPGEDKSAILTLPFLALSGWVLAICGLAGLRRAYGNWRTRRWVRRLHDRGLTSPPVDPRHSNSRGRRRPRRYAG